MTYYLDFLQALNGSGNPKLTLDELTTMISGVIDTGPVRHGLEEGAALLAVIYDWDNLPQIDVLPAYQEVCAHMESLTLQMGANLALEHRLWNVGDDNE